MKLTEAEKKRRQRERAKRGSRIISVEIVDWGAWCEVLREGNFLHGGIETEGSVRGATEVFIWNLCRNYRHAQAHEELKNVPISMIRSWVSTDEALREIRYRKQKRLN
jgi:hypothetical protein